MAVGKKNALFQFLTPLVDSVDFASVESGLTESDINSGITKRYYGYNVGGSAATTSGAISKAISLVRSGVIRVTLKGTETNFDRVMVRLSKTGVAEQIFDFEFVDNDDSDLASAISVGNSRALLLLSNVSDVQSAVLVVQSMASDAASAATQGNSRVLLVQSRLSDLDSRLASELSDIYSLLSNINSVAVASPSGSDIASKVGAELASRLSDILSAAVQTNSRVLVVQSMVSDVDSALTSRFSNLESLVTTTGVQLNASSLSDLRSAITAVTASVSASDMSDIASRVDVLLASRLSDILSAAVQTNSRVLVIQSQTSDLASKLSDVESNLLSLLTTTGVQLNASTMSDLRSAIGDVSVTLSASDISDIASQVAAGITGVTASDISNIASAVLVILTPSFSDVKSAVVVVQSMASDAASAAQQANSRVLVVQSMVSDVDSALTSRFSNLESLVGTTGVQINASSLSDLRSAITAAGLTGSDISDVASAVAAILASDLSNIQSAATQINSRVLAVQSSASDIYSLVSDLHSDVTNLSGVVSDLTSAVTALPTSIWTLTNGVETSVTPQEAMRLILAAAAGEISGAATTTIVIRNVGDTKDRITATVTADGNRTAVTTDAT